MPSGRVEGGLPFISFSDAYEMVGIAQIELSEDGGFLQNFKGRGHEWQGMTVSNSDLIKAPVINARPKSAILLPNKNESSSSGGSGRLDDTCRKGFVDVFVHSSSFGGRQREYTTSGRTGSCEQLNGAIIGPMRRPSFC